jgi:hypothetical protein
MISPRIARELRESGHDVQAIKRDRPDLSGRSDRELVGRMAVERRVIVTNDIDDFQLIADRLLASAEDHAGIVFTSDTTMPRNKAAIPLWVDQLSKLLAEHDRDDSLRNRVHHIVS